MANEKNAKPETSKAENPNLTRGKRLLEMLTFGLLSAKDKDDSGEVKAATWTEDAAKRLAASSALISDKIATLDKAKKEAIKAAREKLAECFEEIADNWAAALFPDEDSEGKKYQLSLSSKSTGAELTLPQGEYVKLSTKALLLGLAKMTDDEALDEVGKGKGARGGKRKAFDNPRKFGGEVDDFEGGNDNFSAIAAVNSIVLDHEGAIADLVKYIIRCSMWADRNDLMQCGELLGVLTGENDCRHGFGFSEETAVKLVQGRMFGRLALAYASVVKDLKAKRDKGEVAEIAEAAISEAEAATLERVAEAREAIAEAEANKPPKPDEAEANKSRAIAGLRADYKAEKAKGKQANPKTMASIVKRAAAFHPDYAERAKEFNAGKIEQAAFDKLCAQYGAAILNPETASVS